MDNTALCRSIKYSESLTVLVYSLVNFKFDIIIVSLTAECRISSSVMTYKDEISSAVYGFCATFF